MTTTNGTLSDVDVISEEKSVQVINVHLYNLSSVFGTTLEPDGRFPIPVFYNENPEVDDFAYAVFDPSGPVDITPGQLIEFALFKMPNNEPITASFFKKTFVTYGKKPIANDTNFTSDQIVQVNNDLSSGLYVQNYDLYFDFIDDKNFTQFCKIDPQLRSTIP